MQNGSKAPEVGQDHNDSMLSFVYSHSHAREYSSWLKHKVTEIDGQIYVKNVALFAVRVLELEPA